MNGKKTFPAPLKYRQELFRITAADEDMNYVKKKYNISDGVLQESIRLIREWYNKQPHFPEIQLEDATIFRNLASNKFSIERTKAKIENLLTAKSVMPDFFNIRDTSHPRVASSLNEIDWIIFPKLTPEKYRVLFTRLVNNNADNYDPCMMFNVGFMLADMRQIVDVADGDVYVWDFGNATFGHITKIPLLLMKKCAFIILSCYGQKVKGIHILNLPSFAEYMINLLKSIYGKKIASRIHAHRSLENLYEYIPKSIFPRDMGGDETMTSNELADKFREAFRSPEWRQWFMDTEQLKTDESKKLPTNCNTGSELRELSGSFRKLDFD